MIARLFAGCVLVMTTPTLAWAQQPQPSMCEAVSTIKDAAPSAFADLQGRLRRNSSYGATYYATVSLPGGQDCRLVTGRRGVNYECDYAGDIRAADAITRDISHCMGVQPDPSRDESGVWAFVEDENVQFYVAYDFGDDTVQVRASQPRQGR